VFSTTELDVLEFRDRENILFYYVLYKYFAVFSTTELDVLEFRDRENILFYNIVIFSNKVTYNNWSLKCEIHKKKITKDRCLVVSSIICDNANCHKIFKYS